MISQLHPTQYIHYGLLHLFGGIVLFGRKVVYAESAAEIRRGMFTKVAMRYKREGNVWSPKVIPKDRQF